jgi:hypothetical protein
MRQDGSLKNALNGEYDFQIREVFKEAWTLVKGSKLIINFALIVYIFAAILVQRLISLIIDARFYLLSHDYIKAFAAEQAQTLLAMPIILPLFAGVIMLGIKRASLKEIKIPSIFNYYVLVWPLVFVSIFGNLAILLGTLLFILPGIYLSVGLSFTTVLIIDKQLGILEAIKISIKAVHQRWWKFFGLYFALSLITIMTTFFTFGIGLIWMVPFIFIVKGVLYRKVFGYSNPQNVPDDTF